MQTGHYCIYCEKSYPSFTILRYHNCDPHLSGNRSDGISSRLDYLVDDKENFVPTSSAPHQVSSSPKQVTYNLHKLINI